MTKFLKSKNIPREGTLVICYLKRGGNLRRVNTNKMVEDELLSYTERG